tara:strand:+ start:648 stop:1109 length:462 start_codon:yes stop_codon:yes gene_type:complete
MATLTVTLQEDLVLNESQVGGTITKEITGINESSKRMLTITTNEATIATFSGAVGSAGHFNDGTVRYIRMTNLHATYFVALTLTNGSNDEFAFKLDAGQSFVLFGDNSTGMELIFNATQAADAASHTALGPLTTIQADAEASTVQIEMFVATT